MFVFLILQQLNVIGDKYFVNNCLCYINLSLLSYCLYINFDCLFILMALHITADNRFRKLIVIGDRVLVRLTRPNEKTESGLYLPPGVQDKEKVQQGYIIRTGPGYAIPMPVDDEPWKQDDEQVRYVPLQAREGDLAIFLLSGATEVMYQGEKYYIVPQSAILMLERDEEL
jgi:co-chaperonin GroES (HSP10)